MVGRLVGVKIRALPIQLLMPRNVRHRSDTEQAAAPRLLAGARARERRRFAKKMISVRKLLDPHAPLDVRAERVGMRSTIHVCAVLVALVLSGSIRGQEAPVRYIDHIMI